MESWPRWDRITLGPIYTLYVGLYCPIHIPASHLLLAQRSSFIPGLSTPSYPQWCISYTLASTQHARLRSNCGWGMASVSTFCSSWIRSIDGYVRAHTPPHTVTHKLIGVLRRLKPVEPTSFSPRWCNWTCGRSLECASEKDYVRFVAGGLHRADVIFWTKANIRLWSRQGGSQSTTTWRFFSEEARVSFSSPSLLVAQKNNGARLRGGSLAVLLRTYD